MATLTSGTVIGQYRIDRKLGAGGMAEVYKATHLMLGREVALKTLPMSEIRTDSSAARFVREARAASALQHPNIVAVYDVADIDGSLFIAMEYVEGKTLHDVLADRALRVEDAIRYAIQIANALAAAHAAGILHRDIKPRNIMITGRNVVKVLDFGLARSFDPPEPGGGASTKTMHDDLFLTREGGVAGTVAYMSPEQAQGFSIDARSDIFAFGIVLYQMLAGSHPFDAPSRIGMTANILRTEPRPLTEVAPGLPAQLEEVVQFCLRKDPEERAHSMHDVARMLEMTEAAIQQPPAVPAPLRTRWRRGLAAGAVLALAAIAGWFSGAFVTPQRASQERPPPALKRMTWDAGLSMAPTLSNDGHLLAFASDRADGKNLDIFVRHISGSEPIRLTSDPADDTDPSFSPDGSTIAFRSERRGGGIYVMPAFGGQQRLIAPRGNNPQFSPDGHWIAYWVGEWANSKPPARMYIIPATGGTPRELQPSFADARFPSWTPDGSHILFQGVDVLRSPAQPSPDWWVTSVDSGPAVKTGAWASFARAGFSFIYPPGGWHGNRIVFSAQDDASRSLFNIPVSMRTWKIEGPPLPLTFGTGSDGAPYASPSGAIAFTSFQYEINIWSRRVDESGRFIDKEARKLTAGEAFHSSASLDNAGTRLVFLQGRTPSRNVWIRNLATGQASPVAMDATDKCAAAISPDGSQVAWSVCGPDRETVYRARVNADFSVSVPEEICADCGRVMDWSHKGDSILFVDHSNPSRAGTLTLASETRTMISSPRYNLNNPRLSPDERWIALTANDTRDDRARIYAIPIRNGIPAPESAWVAVTNGDFLDDRPVWTKRGDAMLFYSRRDGYGCFWRQALNRTTMKPEGAPEEVLEFHSSRLSIKEMVPRSASLFLANNQLLYNALEWTGSIWMLSDGIKKR